METILVLAVHVDDLPIYGNETVCEELLDVLNDQLSPQTLGRLKSYLGVLESVT